MPSAMTASSSTINTFVIRANDTANRRRRGVLRRRLPAPLRVAASTTPCGHGATVASATAVCADLAICGRGSVNRSGRFGDVEFEGDRVARSVPGAGGGDPCPRAGGTGRRRLGAAPQAARRGRTDARAPARLAPAHRRPAGERLRRRLGDLGRSLGPPATPTSSPRISATQRSTSTGTATPPAARGGRGRAARRVRGRAASARRPVVQAAPARPRRVQRDRRRDPRRVSERLRPDREQEAQQGDARHRERRGAPRGPCASGCAARRRSSATTSSSRARRSSRTSSASTRTPSWPRSACGRSPKPSTALLVERLIERQESRRADARRNVPKAWKRLAKTTE